MLDYAGIDRPDAFQGESIRGLIDGGDEPVHDYIFTENLWSTHFGNPRIEAVQNKEWKYIRYYRNHNFPASIKFRVAKEMGIPANKMIYSVNDSGIAVYRHYVKSSLAGEEPVYEELYHLKDDPAELKNLIGDDRYAAELSQLRTAWERKLREARGNGDPNVLRFTAESELERQLSQLR
jgi:hypothetical protein